MEYSDSLFESLQNTSTQMKSFLETNGSQMTGAKKQQIQEVIDELWMQWHAGNTDTAHDLGQQLL